MALSSTSIAPTNAVGAQNVKFAPTATNLQRKILIVGLYDEVGKTTIVQNTVYPVNSADEVGDIFGFGFSVHRLAMQTFKGGQGIPTYIIPVDRDAAPVASTGTLTIVCTSASAGTLHLYISGDYVPVSVVKGADETDIADAVTAECALHTDLPVTVGNVAGVITFTSKDLGIDANNIIVSMNEKLGQETPTGITSAAIVAQASGAGVMDSDMATALAALGTGDSANALHITDMVHGFGDDTTVLDDISEYVGEADTFTGCWAKTLEPPRPFRALCGDIVADSAGLTAARALGVARRTLDRTNGQISVPGSPNHPNEIAALAIGIMANINNERPAQTFVGLPMSGILPGSKTDDWTSDYDNRNAALVDGNSPTKVVGGTVMMQKVVTFYHPASVAPASNGYRSFVSISKLQNILNSWWLNFADAKWQGNAVVGNVSNVSNPTARQKAKDTNSILGDVTALTYAFEAQAWIFEAAFTIDKLKSELAQRITIRSGTTGWDILYPILLSGEGDIINGTVQFDTDIAVLG
jgi:phage tail sheath gpL-like